ncbi:hypothetical protein LOY70_22865 [Pseudomonas sp. B21-054]|uniref:hypothetical protein n=1 Tax=Pseudomonas sp. B21-054 TaxID=2895494 RepID=UPI00222F669A|nr:hypothetical protein [Pseudomonas sp. B21-054]UZE16700.1 hypothetical protein LOY70_22865 [Pseudomonas sp. B21-054]
MPDEGLLAAVDLEKSFVAAADAGNKQKNVRVILKRLCTQGGGEPLRRLQAGVIPCKGILQARLRRHYKDFFAYVLRRNGPRRSWWVAFPRGSEGLQGFGR